ncbi:MAG: type II toxin-antitoxin system PemK/MazF family toxin, partial [Thermoplasmata archaeon]
MVITKGDVWWADLPPADDATAAFPRPVVVVQSNSLNACGIGTILCMPLTGNLSRASADGGVLLKADETGLPKDSVGLGPLLIAVPRPRLRARVGSLAPNAMHLVSV